MTSEGSDKPVLLLVDDSKTKNGNDTSHWKNLLGSMPDVGSDEDFARSLDYGREISWDS